MFKNTALKIATSVLIFSICVPHTGYAMTGEEEQELLIPVIYSTGNLGVSVCEQEGLGLNASLKTPDQAFTETFLDDADWEQLQNAQDIDVSISWAPYDYKDIKEIIEATSPVESSSKVIAFDISVTKTGNTATMSSVYKDLEFEFDAPGDFDASKMQDTKLIAVHKTGETTYEVEYLVLRYDAQTKKLSFTTSRFSPYALIYKPISSGQNNVPTPGGSDIPSTDKDNPGTDKSQESETKPADNTSGKTPSDKTPSDTPGASEGNNKSPISPDTGATETSQPGNNSTDKTTPIDQTGTKTTPVDQAGTNSSAKTDTSQTDNANTRSRKPLFTNLIHLAQAQQALDQIKAQDNASDKNATSSSAAGVSNTTSNTDSSQASDTAKLSGTIISNEENRQTGTSTIVTQTEHGNYVTEDNMKPKYIRIAIISLASVLILVMLYFSIKNRRKNRHG